MRWDVRLMRLRGLRRFLDAQDAVWNDVVHELACGEKRTHWVWFVFPQRLGLGQSRMSQVYGLTDREARRYWRNRRLRGRLLYGMALVRWWVDCGASLEEVFGPVDAMKFRSSMDLFAAASDGDMAFDGRWWDVLSGTHPLTRKEQQ